MVQPTTYRVSDTLLAREDFREACAARDFRTVFQLMRKYDGASQDRISSPVEGLTQSRVSRIMRGDDRVASLDLIERIVDSLGIPGSYVGLVSREWETDEATSDAGATVTTIHPRAAVTTTGRAGVPVGRLATAAALADEPAFRQRAAGILDRSLGAVLDAVTELRDLDIVTDATAEVRVHNLAPLFKLYLINGREAFFGFYPIAEHTVRAGGGIHPMYDLMGKDSVLFHHSSDDTDAGSAADLYGAQARMWFNSIWATVSQDHHRA